MRDLTKIRGKNKSAAFLCRKTQNLENLYYTNLYLLTKNIPTKFEHRSSTLTPTYVLDKDIHENELQNGHICLIYLQNDQNAIGILPNHGLRPKKQ